jgi:hypothetical protein
MKARPASANETPWLRVSSCGMIVVSDKDNAAIGAATAVRVARLRPDIVAFIAILSRAADRLIMRFKDVKAIGLVCNHARVMSGWSKVTTASNCAGGCAVRSGSPTRRDIEGIVRRGTGHR